MKLLIAADHAGYALKEDLKKANPQIQWEDLGPFNTDRVDYPDFADLVASKVAQDPKNTVGVLICGSGQGMAIRANRYKGVRAALVWNEEVTTLSRTHNNANIMALGSKWTNADQATKFLKIFLESEFEGGRHLERVEKMDRNC